MNEEMKSLIIFPGSSGSNGVKLLPAQAGRSAFEEDVTLYGMERSSS
jgi:hypothetical protein